jgi:hypothetical protein
LQSSASNVVQSVHDRGLDFCRLREGIRDLCGLRPVEEASATTNGMRISDGLYRNFEFGLPCLSNVCWERFMSMSIQKSDRITSTSIITSTRITCLLEDGIG